jgi:hypothetical protein
MSLVLDRTTTRPGAGSALSALPPDQDPTGAHAALAGLSARALGPDWAGLFATPRREGDTVVWEAEGAAVRRYFDLPAEERTALRSSLGAALSETRRAAEREGGALAPLLAAAIEIPGWEAVHLVDGRPVLAPWGLRPAGRAPGASPLVAVDDGVPARLPSVIPWAPIAATLAALALLAVLAILFLRWWAPWVTPPVAVACRADPAQFGALAGLLGEEQRVHTLGAELARLQGELGRRQSECPIAELPPEPPPPPPPRQAETPPPRQPPVRPPDAQPCDAETRSGGRGITRTRHFLGDRPGQVTLTYNTLIEPDHIEVLYRGRQLATTRWPVSGRGSISFDWRPTGSGPEAHVVEVVVTGFGLTTRWNYTLGCPR